MAARRRSNWDRAAGRLNVALARFDKAWRRWLRPPRRLSFTREGKYFVGITIGVGFAAINTGNNLFTCCSA